MKLEDSNSEFLNTAYLGMNYTVEDSQLFILNALSLLILIIMLGEIKKMTTLSVQIGKVFIKLNGFSNLRHTYYYTSRGKRSSTFRISSCSEHITNMIISIGNLQKSQYIYLLL